MIIIHDFKIEISRLNNCGKTDIDNKNNAHDNNDGSNDNNTADTLELEKDVIRMDIIGKLSEYDISFINDYSAAFRITIIKKSLDLRQRIGKSVFLFALEILGNKPDAKELYIKDKKYGSIEDYLLDLLLKSGFKARIATEKEKEIYYLNSPNKNLYKINPGKPNVIIIGMGPAGIFAAVELLKNGIKPIIIEQGKKVEDRKNDVEQFFNNALFNPRSNVVFGEGGAGTFSDGKLTTRKKDYYVGYCMNFLVQMGADKNILTENRPHIGSDVLIEILKNIRKYLIAQGAELRFEEELKEIIIFDKNNNGGTGISDKKSLYKLQQNENEYKYENINLKLDGIRTDKETINTDYLILAAGANNFKLYEMLSDKGVKMEQKPFAIGFRIEHRREFIDKILLRDHQKLSGLYYNLSSKKFGGYSFCMCPGGVVVGSSSEEEHLCINGMSYSGRDLDNSNSAIVTTIMPADLLKLYNCGLSNNTADNININVNINDITAQDNININVNINDITAQDNRKNEEDKRNKNKENKNKENKNNKKDDSLSMLNFRRDLEKKAFIAGGGSFSAPFQYTAEYLEDISKNYNYNDNDKYKNFFKNIKHFKTEYSSKMPIPSYKPAVTRYELFKLLPESINIKLAGTLTEFNEKFNGFIDNSVLTGIEAGTSSAVRILRDKNFQSINVEGIYPCGEGSGYSGGIITSAIDGVKCAISIVEKITDK